MSLGAPSGPIAEDVKSTMREAGMNQQVTSLVYGIGGRDLSVEDGRRIFGLIERGALSGDTSVMYGVKG